MFYKDNGSGLLKCRELVINIWNSHQFSNIDDNSFLSSPLWKQIPQCGKIWWLAHKWCESVECPKKGSTFCSISSTKVKPKDSSDADPDAWNKPTKGRRLGRWPWTRGPGRHAHKQLGTMTRRFMWFGNDDYVHGRRELSPLFVSSHSLA